MDVDLTEGLKKKYKEKDKPAPTLTTCLKCYAIYPIALTSCPECGTLKPRPSAADLAHRDGTLKEVKYDPAKAIAKRQRRDQNKAAKTYEDLVELGKSRGYKNPQAWAYFIRDARKHGRRA